MTLIKDIRDSSLAHEGPHDTIIPQISLYMQTSTHIQGTHILTQFSIFSHLEQMLKLNTIKAQHHN
jgi:hypothetical protein